MLKEILVGAVLASAVSMPAFASPQLMSSGQLEEVVAGTIICPPVETGKGNNGWGNGADPSNPGSGSGLTGPSKTANNNLPPGQNRPNTNPTGTSGR